MDTKEPTICVKCKHIISDSLVCHCDASPRIYYVTGELQHSACAIKNDKGTCADYEEADDDQGQS